MKTALAIFLVFFTAYPAFAEKVRPSGWSEATGIHTTRRAATGNRIISVEEHKNRKPDTGNSWLDGSKPVVSKNADGSIRMKKQLDAVNMKKAASIWSNLNN